MEVRTIDVPRALLTTFERFECLLSEKRTLIDRLNVFPVPDGDTGTNMYLTAKSIKEAVAELDPTCTEFTELCHTASMAALLGARGNSGVILSQLVQGFAGYLGEGYHAHMDSKELGNLVADALIRAAELARGAVLKPKEGTILTVASAGAQAARRAADNGEDLDGVLEGALRGAREALERTPELLEQLRAAGVVDSGGAGLIHLLEAVWFGFRHREPEGDLAKYPWLDRATELGGPLVGDISGSPTGGDLEKDLRFEVMFLLRSGSAQTIDAMKEVWEGLGDSIVVVGQSGTWNCHIHTNEIGPVIEAAIDAGSLRNLRVTDLSEQVREERWVREAANTTEPTRHEEEAVETGVVAVSNGDGVARIFHSLGVKAIVLGGQSMNPSTSSLLEAIEGCDARSVVVLPNNSNVIAVASAAAQMSTKAARVLRTSSVIEGFSSLMEYDPASPIEENLTAMTRGAAMVRYGEVTTAVRSGTSKHGTFEAGCFIGLHQGSVEVADVNLAQAVVGLLQEMLKGGGEIVTLLSGEGSMPSATREITEYLLEHFPSLQVEVHQGGQALYPYLVGIE